MLYRTYLWQISNIAGADLHKIAHPHHTTSLLPKHSILWDSSRHTNMSHCHDEHDGHHHHHGEDHDHSDDITPALQFSLYQHINFDEVTTLNASDDSSGKAIVKKTWAERLDLEPELASDCDEQLIINIP